MQFNSKRWSVILLVLLVVSVGFNFYYRKSYNKVVSQLNEEKLKLDSVLSLKLQSDYALRVMRDSVNKGNTEKRTGVSEKDAATGTNSR